ncbi:hypothetical protein AU210_012515 [Fusarium oxysporum f. sp. radicis-cucumerinum]|uniref:Uncharacterized protein n=3 Tax=Fusarium oxysporum TaxID=5507 RepID=A0A2H3GKJ7_FUSOX|nr:hypothetical protein AU210_012515 [Fusarium oxysporum f. sp. radicis-cucumerinum]RKK10038.1 hypothetical protein BFJ65_g15341 [Fusarium oxysporum f. sp. cepae]RKK26762.1 hypothetical protein BFJ67_g16472 [Fusarium oxysporum f. sp. cepae]RKK40110.1 hypothetical protein BFJ66_g11649 [Fusarium oxysporum f. sp. cepae]RKK95331.1 hypothetical protein BFJ68_g14829 [Fusarium oxysporum]
MASSNFCLITPNPTPSPTPFLSSSTPTPLLRPAETPPEDKDNHEATLRYHFRGWALSEHGIRAPFSKTKGTAEKKADSLSVKATGQKSIVEALKLDLHNPREQAIANTVIKRFDRDHFQRLLMNWIIARNHSFSIAEENELQEIFDYLNPSVSVRDAKRKVTYNGNAEVLVIKKTYKIR